MRNVTELSKLNGKVYVYLRDEVIARKFLQDAENEGFTFGDGEKPTARPGNNLYVVNRDWTISHVGWAGHMAFQSAKSIGEQELIRVDYEKYLLGEEEYLIIRFSYCAIRTSALASGKNRPDPADQGRKPSRRSFGCRDFCTAIRCKLVTSEKESNR